MRVAGHVTAFVLTASAFFFVQIRVAGQSHSFSAHRCSSSMQLGLPILSELVIVFFLAVFTVIFHQS
jgi:hypothetical protein